MLLKQDNYCIYIACSFIYLFMYQLNCPCVSLGTSTPQDSLMIVLEVMMHVANTESVSQLDMTEVFSDSAKLPYMIDGTQGRVGAIVHKAKIEVTEKGTRAAAASGTYFSGTNRFNPNYYRKPSKDKAIFIFLRTLSVIFHFSFKCVDVTNNSKTINIYLNRNLLVVSGCYILFD